MHRWLQRHGVSHGPEIGSDKPAKTRFAAYPIGRFHIDLAEVQIDGGELRLVVALDHASKSAFALLTPPGTSARSGRRSA